MKEKDFLSNNVFKTIIDNTPLVSVDIIVKKDNHVLLGKRVNKPAQGYWFTLGGRVLKNERIEDAIKRISKIELGIDLQESPSFIGVFEHIYHDSIYQDISTHYVNLGYEIELSEIKDLPMEQHTMYKWFLVDELMNAKNVHHYVKDYFSKELGTIPQRKKGETDDN